MPLQKTRSGNRLSDVGINMSKKRVKKAREGIMVLSSTSVVGIQPARLSGLVCTHNTHKITNVNRTGTDVW